MTVSHSEEEMRDRASLYALGSLEADEAAKFEQHLDEGCESCASELQAFASVVEQLAWADIGATPPAELREKLLARIALEDASSRVEEKEARRVVPQASEPLGLLMVRAGEGEWQETEDAGVFVKLLFKDAERDSATTLVRISPGARVPRHRHIGVEQCFVLEGDLRSGGAVNVSGDYICAQPGTIHEELTTEQGALLLIVAPESYEVLQAAPRRSA
jgi:anti-sigma factor ChrR (cupin superfamily)